MAEVLSMVKNKTYIKNFTEKNNSSVVIFIIQRIESKVKWVVEIDYSKLEIEMLICDSVFCLCFISFNDASRKIIEPHRNVSDGTTLENQSKNEIPFGRPKKEKKPYAKNAHFTVDSKCPFCGVAGHRVS